MRLNIRYKNYKGGINNLIIAQEYDTGLFATSKINVEQAIKNQKKKIKKMKRDSINYKI